MAIDNEGYCGMEIELMENIGSTLTKGRKGICTADLQSLDRFAVWFAEPISVAENGTPIHWATFEWAARDKFRIIGDLRAEMAEMLAPLIARIQK